MRTHVTALFLFTILAAACGVPGDEPYAGWDTYTDPSERFMLRYISPPWTECNETEYEDDCHECPGQLIGNGRCGGGSNWTVLWIPPALLDPEFLLIPPYKLEVSWFSSSTAALALAQAEQTAMAGAGMEVLFEARAVTLHDGTVAAEIGYRGPVHIVVDETPVNRPDEREYRVVYVADAGTVYRVALDTAINMDLPEVRDMLASFSFDVPEVDP